MNDDLTLRPSLVNSSAAALVAQEEEKTLTFATPGTGAEKKCLAQQSSARLAHMASYVDMN